MQNAYTVSQINAYIKSMFSEDFMLRKISVKGEVSNVKYHTSGHLYFTLKDESAAIAAVMFAGSRRGLKFRMENGDKVVVTGSVEVYERDGKYQLYAKEIVSDGAGDLFLRYERLKAELTEMGMFAPEYKKPIPRYAKKIGVVTAPTGAAVQDIKNVTLRRNPFAELLLFPAKVQGDGAVESIVNGIRALDMRGLDVIIVGRGGGSIEDLWAFNEEATVRAIFECETPVISAVGHETDTTLSDFVADLRAPTPSAAAELATFDWNQLMTGLGSLENQMSRLASHKLALTKHRLSATRAELLKRSPERSLERQKLRLAELSRTLPKEMEAMINSRKTSLMILSEALSARSPLLTLGRGYGYVTGEAGEAKRSVSEFSVGESITVRLLDGKLNAAVTAVEAEEFSHGKEE